MSQEAEFIHSPVPPEMGATISRVTGCHKAEEEEENDEKLYPEYDSEEECNAESAAHLAESQKLELLTRIKDAREIRDAKAHQMMALQQLACDFQEEAKRLDDNLNILEKWYWSHYNEDPNKQLDSTGMNALYLTGEDGQQIVRETHEAAA